MLGEAARTQKDADLYFERYMAAIDAVGQSAGPFATMHLDALYKRPGLSVKLSALHPRFEAGKEDRLAAELTPRLLALARAARSRGLSLTIDAEEQDRLEPSLTQFGAIFADPLLDNWNGLGFAVQAYGKRAVPTLRWLRRIAERAGKRIPVRLVKGAYWDSEIKWAQERALVDYPVFTRKVHTDLSYLACVRLLLSDAKAFYPQFATHNAHALAAAHVAGGPTVFEFQRLHGMGEALYEEVVGDRTIARPCRIYAPVGGHEDLLAYLVRRLLENGANTSFVNRLADEEAPIAALVRDPIEEVESERSRPVEAPAAVPLPRDIYLPARQVAGGLALTEPSVRTALVAEMIAALDQSFEAGPIIAGKVTTGGTSASLITCPHDRREHIGTSCITTPAQANMAIDSALAAQSAWDARGGAGRAEILENAAELFERDRARLMAVIVREAGKTLEAAQGDVREAVDYLRFYAGEARRIFSGADRAARSDGRTQHPDAARSRAVRLHLAVEFSIGDFHGPGRSRPCRRQYRAGEAGRADADHRVRGHASPAQSRGSRRCAPPLDRQRPAGRGAGQGRPRQRRRRSPAPTRPPGRSSACWPTGVTRSCRSSPRPAASTP